MEKVSSFREQQPYVSTVSYATGVLPAALPVVSKTESYTIGLFLLQEPNVTLIQTRGKETGNRI